MKLFNLLTIYAAAKKVQKIEKSEEPFRDEVHYPRRVLDRVRNRNKKYSRLRSEISSIGIGTDYSGVGNFDL